MEGILVYKPVQLRVPHWEDVPGTWRLQECILWMEEQTTYKAGYWKPKTDGTDQEHLFKKQKNLWQPQGYYGARPPTDHGIPAPCSPNNEEAESGQHQA